MQILELPKNPVNRITRTTHEPAPAWSSAQLRKRQRPTGRPGGPGRRAPELLLRGGRKAPGATRLGLRTLRTVEGRAVEAPHLGPSGAGRGARSAARGTRGALAADLIFEGSGRTARCAREETPRAPRSLRAVRAVEALAVAAQHVLPRAPGRFVATELNLGLW